MDLLKSKKPNIADEISAFIQQQIVVRKEKEKQDRQKGEEGF